MKFIRLFVQLFVRFFAVQGSFLSDKLFHCHDPDYKEIKYDDKGINIIPQNDFQIDLRILTIDSDNNQTKNFYPWKIPSISPAIKTAYSKINNTEIYVPEPQNIDPKFYPDNKKFENPLILTYNIEFINDYCSSEEVLNRIIYEHFCQFGKRRKETDIYIGASCDIVVEYIDNLCDSWKIPLISVGSRDDIFINGLIINQEDSTLVRVGPTAEILNKALASIANFYDWENVVIAVIKFTDKYSNFSRHSAPVDTTVPHDCQVYFRGLQAMGDLPYRHNRAYDIRYLGYWTLDLDEFLESQDIAQIEEFLLEIQKLARIYFWCMDESVMFLGFYFFLSVSISLNIQFFFNQF